MLLWKCMVRCTVYKKDAIVQHKGKINLDNNLEESVNYTQRINSKIISKC